MRNDEINCKNVDYAILQDKLKSLRRKPTRAQREQLTMLLQHVFRDWLHADEAIVNAISLGNAGHQSSIAYMAWADVVILSEPICWVHHVSVSYRDGHIFINEALCADETDITKALLKVLKRLATYWNGKNGSLEYNRLLRNVNVLTALRGDA